MLTRTGQRNFTSSDLQTINKHYTTSQFAPSAPGLFVAESQTARSTNTTSAATSSQAVTNASSRTESLQQSILQKPNRAEAAAESINRTLTPDAQGNIHEEELQFALINFLLGEAGPEVSYAFRASVEANLQNAGDPPLFEDVVKQGLKDVVASNLLSPDSAEWINGVSFRAAQLDSQLDTLLNASDSTIAIAAFGTAVTQATQTLDALVTGALPISGRSLNAPSNTVPNSNFANTPIGGTTGFLWKPNSERDGKLVILLPAELSDKIVSAELHSSMPPSELTLIEQGNFSGSSQNGGRAHFRFEKPGGRYPDGSVILATLNSGEQISFQIGNSKMRNSL